jgi:hypothetical protein
MKKLCTLVAIAALFAGCCGKQQPVGITVEKFFENASSFVGKDTVLIGTIKDVCCCSGNFVLGTKEDNSKLTLTVTPPEDVKICKKCIGKEVAVKGTINEVIIDEEFVIALENEGNASDEPEIKEHKQKVAAEYRELIAVEGIFSIYTMEAKCVKCTGCCKDGDKKDGCCKDGEKKDGCCKDGEKKDGCCKDGEKKDGCCKDGEKKDGCCKDGEKKDGCCKEKKEECEKSCEKK